MKEIVVNTSARVAIIRHRMLRKQFDETDVPTGDIEINYLLLVINGALTAYMFNKEQQHIYALAVLMRHLKVRDMEHYGGGKILFIKSKDKKDKTLSLRFSGDAQYIGMPTAEKIRLIARAFWPGSNVSIHGAAEVSWLTSSMVRNMITKINERQNKVPKFSEA